MEHELFILIVWPKP